MGYGWGKDERGDGGVGSGGEVLCAVCDSGTGVRVAWCGGDGVGDCVELVAQCCVGGGQCLSGGVEVVGDPLELVRVVFEYLVCGALLAGEHICMPLRQFPETGDLGGCIQHVIGCLGC